MFKIPDHIFWPGFIIGLLGIAITASFTILYFAQSDGGPQVIPDYYQRSVNYDDYYRARQNSIELGWQVEVQLKGDLGQLRLFDRDDEPLEGIQGTLTFYRPHLADSVATVELVEVPDKPGLYTFDDAATRSGYWDVALKLERDDDVFVQTIRKDVPQS